MEHVKGWDKEEDDYALLQANLIRKSPRKHLKDIVGTVESLDIKQKIVPTKKANKIKAKKVKTSTKRNRVLEETLNVWDIRICQKLSALCFGEYGHFPENCPKSMQ